MKMRPRMLSACAKGALLLSSTTWRSCESFAGWTLRRVKGTLRVRRINALSREASLAQVLGEWTRLKDEEAKLLGGTHGF